MFGRRVSNASDNGSVGGSVGGGVFVEAAGPQLTLAQKLAAAFLVVPDNHGLTPYAAPGGSYPVERRIAAELLGLLAVSEIRKNDLKVIVGAICQASINQAGAKGGLFRQRKFLDQVAKVVDDHLPLSEASYSRLTSPSSDKKRHSSARNLLRTLAIDFSEKSDKDPKDLFKLKFYADLFKLLAEASIKDTSLDRFIEVLINQMSGQAARPVFSNAAAVVASPAPAGGAGVGAGAGAAAASDSDDSDSDSEEGSVADGAGAGAGSASVPGAAAQAAPPITLEFSRAWGERLPGASQTINTTSRELKGGPRALRELMPYGNSDDRGSVATAPKLHPANSDRIMYNQALAALTKCHQDAKTVADSAGVRAEAVGTSVRAAEIRLTAAHQAELADLRAGHGGALSDLRVDYEKALADLRTDHEEVLAAKERVIEGHLHAVGSLEADLLSFPATKLLAQANTLALRETTFQRMNNACVECINPTTVPFSNLLNSLVDGTVAALSASGTFGSSTLEKAAYLAVFANPDSLVDQSHITATLAVFNDWFDKKDDPTFVLAQKYQSTLVSVSFKGVGSHLNSFFTRCCSVAHNVDQENAAKKVALLCLLKVVASEYQKTLKTIVTHDRASDVALGLHFVHGDKVSRQSYQKLCFCIDVLAQIYASVNHADKAANHNVRSASIREAFQTTFQKNTEECAVAVDPRNSAKHLSFLVHYCDGKIASLTDGLQQFKSAIKDAFDSYLGVTQKLPSVAFQVGLVREGFPEPVSVDDPDPWSEYFTQAMSALEPQPAAHLDRLPSMIYSDRRGASGGASGRGPGSVTGGSFSGYGVPAGAGGPGGLSVHQPASRLRTGSSLPGKEAPAESPPALTGHVTSPVGGSRGSDSSVAADGVVGAPPRPGSATPMAAAAGAVVGGAGEGGARKGTGASVRAAVVGVDPFVFIESIRHVGGSR